MGYCERLLLNTIELKKHPNGRYFSYPKPQIMLFEGDVDGENFGLDQESDMITEELIGDQGRNKLLSRDSIDLIMFVSFGIGMLILFYAHLTKNNKIGHSYLPRPN